MNFDQKSNVEVTPVRGDFVVLRASLLFGPDNNETRWRYVPAVKHVTWGADRLDGPRSPFTTYACFYKGGSGERPISFTNKKEAVKFLDAPAAKVGRFGGEPCGYCGSTEGFSKGADGWDKCDNCGGV